MRLMQSFACSSAHSAHSPRPHTVETGNSAKVHAHPTQGAQSVASRRHSAAKVHLDWHLR